MSINKIVKMVPKPNNKFKLYKIPKYLLLYGLNLSK